MTTKFVLTFYSHGQIIDGIYFQSHRFILYILSTELRFCDRCMVKTPHQIIEDPEIIYTYKRRRLYRCNECGHKSFKRGLRPSAESVY